MKNFVSRAGEKLDFAIEKFKLDVTGFVCADFGCSTGGFTDCLLQRGAARVYCIDTAYGELEYKLRIDPRVIVMERQNALHVVLPEKVDLVVSDVNWTRQTLIVPKGFELLKTDCKMISLLKPHYEVDTRSLRGGKLENNRLNEVTDKIKNDLELLGIRIIGIEKSPILGKKGGNTEFIMLLEQLPVTTKQPNF
jgi:23S rRNA (cytidine1920-2'-O)/16S rRNA (cytidine1409-2'-O)-methyltransferase